MCKVRHRKGRKAWETSPSLLAFQLRLPETFKVYMQLGHTMAHMSQLRVVQLAMSAEHQQDI